MCSSTGCVAVAELTPRAKAVRRRQYLLMAGVLVVVAAVSIGGTVWMSSRQGKPTQKETPKTSTVQLGGRSTEGDSWRVQSGADLEAMKRRLTELERAERDRLATLQREAAERAKTPPPAPLADTTSVPPPIPPLTPNPRPGMGNPGAAGAGLFNQVGPMTTPPPPPPLKRPTARDEPGDAPAPAASRIRSVSLPVPPSSPPLAEADAKKAAEEAEAKGKTYLPRGTFMRASLLNGVDAPTGGQAQQNPHPLLLRLEEPAQLPNGARANVKGCFVTAAGVGDLSAERAYIKTDALSCVDDEGGVVDVSIKGYVAGEDGKTGVRGRLVTKTGTVLANAIVVGLFSGFGEALRQQAVSTTTGLATGVQTQTVNNSLQYGLGTGIGRSMDRVSQYYLRLADKLFPVIEVDGGRVVDIVLTRGVSIERH